MQQLLFPLSKPKLTASWQTEAYRVRFGFEHYGIDAVSRDNTRTVRASGYGLVVEAGSDNVVGNILVIRYINCQRRGSGSASTLSDLIVRTMHHDRLMVKKGDLVYPGLVIAFYGNTGQYSSGAHLHLEVDIDTSNPLYSPTVAASSLLVGSSEAGLSKQAMMVSMSNPLEWLWLSPGESWSTNNDPYIANADKTLPAIELEDDKFPQIKSLAQQIQNLC